MEDTYRMTDRDIRLMIKLRATNEAIFTGRRNSAMRAWRAIRKDMGLQGKLTARQLKKKWENLKEKYKVLKNPPEGLQSLTKPNSWRWFHLMDEAMTGHLAGSAHILNTSLFDQDKEEEAAWPRLCVGTVKGTVSGLSVGNRGPPEGVRAPGEVGAPWEGGAHGGVRAPRGVGSPNPTECEQALLKSEDMMENSQTAVLYATILSDCTATAPENYNVEVNEAALSSINTDRNITMETAELDRQIAELETERQALERERELLNREMASIEWDRVSIERERVVLDRDRAVLDRDRAVLDRDRAMLERDRAMLERDRANLERDRVDLKRGRTVLDRDRVDLDRHQAEMPTEKEVVLQTRFYQSWMAADLDPDQLETRQRLVSLFQRFIEKL